MPVTVKKVVKLSTQDLINFVCEKYNLDSKSAEIVFETKTVGTFRDEWTETVGIQITANDKTSHL